MYSVEYTSAPTKFSMLIVVANKYIENRRDPYANLLWPRNKMNSEHRLEKTLRCLLFSYSYIYQFCYIIVLKLKRVTPPQSTPKCDTTRTLPNKANKGWDLI